MEMGDLQSLIKTNVDLATSFSGAASGIVKAATCAVTTACPGTEISKVIPTATVGIRG